MVAVPLVSVAVDVVSAVVPVAEVPLVVDAGAAEVSVVVVVVVVVLAVPVPLVLVLFDRPLLAALLSVVVVVDDGIVLLLAVLLAGVATPLPVVVLVVLVVDGAVVPEVLVVELSVWANDAPANRASEAAAIRDLESVRMYRLP